MDSDPRTRKESKKDTREKKGGKYSAKHIRIQEDLKARKK